MLERQPYCINCELIGVLWFGTYLWFLINVPTQTDTIFLIHTTPCYTYLLAPLTPSHSPPLPPHTPSHFTIYPHSLMNEVVHTSPTIGSNVEEVKWRNIHFVMWDIGGQESLRQAWSTYYSGTSFTILVVDSTDRDRLTITKEELYKMLSHEVSVFASLRCIFF